MNDKPKLHGLQKLRADYRAGLPAKLAVLAENYGKLSEAGWQENYARQIHSACHHLAGTGKTFGYSNITTYARVVESHLNEIFDLDSPPSASQLAELDAVVDVLLVKGPVADGESVTSSRDLVRPSTPSKAKKIDLSGGSRPEIEAASSVKPLSALPVYIVEDDEDLADQIVMELITQGYDACAVNSLQVLEEAILETGRAPGAIVMDVIFPDSDTGGIDIMDKLRNEQILQAPVIFMSASDSFSTRLEVVRAGGEAFFVKPFDVSELSEKLASMIGNTNVDPLRILVVDDDEIYANHISLVLRNAGLDTRAINKPTTVIGEVLEFRPDLVIVDMYMPEVNGMEVAQVLRQHESCGSIPLLFLSAEQDPAKQYAALNVGVDDFLVKPIEDGYLISAVANRAQRGRALEAKIYRDSLTHLLVHDEIKNQLADKLATARRYSRELSYAILDLDNFKRINDSYGHLTGDHVIKSIANLLRRSFRRSDVIGRYGGEEFAVIMQDTDIADATIVLDKVRYEFSRITQTSEIDSEAFFVTFSAGVSGFPAFDEVEDILISADRALYDAKQSGRNKICIV